MTPYYSDDAVTIYHGDCRDILPSLSADVLITDPPYGIALDGANNFASRLPNDPPALVGDKVTRNGLDVFRHMWSGAFRDSERGTALHPSQKPVALMRWIVDLVTKPGEVIVDPYLGSGPVLAAAKDLGRKAIGIEIDERYCEVAARRCSQEVLGLSA